MSHIEQNGFRNNTGDWKAHLEMSERGKDRENTRESQWLCLPAHKQQHGKRTLSSLGSLLSTHTESRMPASPDRQLLVPRPVPQTIGLYQLPLLRNVALFTVQTSIPRDNYNHSLSSKNSLPKCTIPSFLHTGKQLGAHSWTPLRSLWERVPEWPTRQSIHTY